MNEFIQNLTGTGDMTEQVIASDLLIAAKSAIKNYALALTETVTPEVRTVLRNQLDTAITSHENILNYMMLKGYYHAYNPNEQLNIDLANAEKTIGLPEDNRPIL